VVSGGSAGFNLRVRCTPDYMNVNRMLFLLPIIVYCSLIYNGMVGILDIGLIVRSIVHGSQASFISKMATGERGCKTFQVLVGMSEGLGHLFSLVLFPHSSKTGVVPFKD